MAEPLASRDERAIVYEWLSSLFLAPLTEAQIAAYREGPGAGLLEALGEAPALAPGIATMRGAIAALPAEGAEALLSRAYGLLFLGAGGPETVPPYESVYRNEFGRVCQEPMARMEALLRRHHLRIGEGCREPADHVAIELAVRAALLRRLDGETSAIAGRDGGDLLRWMLGWIPDFAALCRRLDQTGFYAGAATVLAAFLEAERGTRDHHDISKEKADDDRITSRSPELAPLAAHLSQE